MDYPEDFERFWRLWIATARPRDPKKLAFKAWSCRLREGISPTLLEECAQEYTRELRQKGSAGTCYVMMAATFLGPNERWAEYKPKGGDAPVSRNSLEPKHPAGLSAAIPEERIDARPFLRDLIEKLAAARTVKEPQAKKSPTSNYARGR